ncbi:origin recognition complex subunit 6-domain-containing protein [Morchella snyderi]|nr:origin recognition complex subunit 6-domain-containing protein [Morchella snyderi]
MNSIENHLTSLIPTLAGPLPPELIQLAASLVAQSKNRISNLKPNEEICREYVCAHIACDRLRTQLDLPTITPRLPLPKKTYGALYTQFQKALPLRTRAPTAPPASSATGTGNGASTSTPADAPPPTPITLSPPLRASIHTLCTALGAPGAHRHVIAGTTSMLSEPSSTSAPLQQRSQLPLVTAITLLTIERLLPEGKNVTVGAAGKWRRGEGYIMKRDGVMGALGGVGKAGFTKEDTDGWVKELSRRGIRELPWLKDVPDGVGLKVRAGDKVEVELVVGTVKKGRKPAVKKGAAAAAANKKKKKKGGEEPGVAGVQGGEEPVVVEEPVVEQPQKKMQTRAARPKPKPAVVAMPAAKRQKVDKVESGIGSFMQGSVDYLGETKRRTYKTWEARVLAMAAELEREGVPPQQQQAAVVGGG